MFRRVKGVVEPKDFIFDIFGFKGPVYTITLEGIDPVSSPSIEGILMEETGVGIPLRKPVNSRFNSLEFLPLLKEVTIIFNEIPFKVIEKVVSGIRLESLDAN